MKTVLGLATEATFRLSRDLVSNGSCGTRKQKKRWQSCVITSFVSFQRIGKKFTGNGWRTFATGASAVRYDEGTGSRPGTGSPKSQTLNPNRGRKYTSA